MKAFLENRRAFLFLLLFSKPLADQIRFNAKKG